MEKMYEIAKAVRMSKRHEDMLIHQQKKYINKHNRSISQSELIRLAIEITFGKTK